MSSYKFKIPTFGVRNNSPSGVSSAPSGGKRKWLYVALFLMALFILGLIIYLGNYIITSCAEKKTLRDYMMDMSLDACISSADAGGNLAMAEEEDLDHRQASNEYEVFHISNQDYTFEQAKCKCAAYGGRLATKDEIVDAYNRGADWCSYGWSAGQTAYYPTQKCTWDKLQEHERHKNDCGHPGVNGGFFANPKLKFGINCFGIKPKGALVREKPAKCEQADFCAMDTNSFASTQLETDVIKPFNSGRWSLFH